MPETPFDNVEAAHEYVGLLAEAVRQARDEVVQDVEQARASGAARQLEALQLVAWKLERLETHLASSRHLLNDLRRLRRLLLGEAPPPSTRSGGDDPEEPWGA
ncbi:MAG TPA: hypothetical protein VLF95_13305 [Vicinamibacteria bacterium]|nr:hypothetical protein [Vicinamibacteria bacterium]